MHVQALQHKLDKRGCQQMTLSPELLVLLARLPDGEYLFLSCIQKQVCAADDWRLPDAAHLLHVRAGYAGIAKKLGVPPPCLFPGVRKGAHRPVVRIAL